MARILVAMSGGVDSSVAAALLVRAGHEVIGVTFNQWPFDLMARATGNGCCTPRTIDDARRVCQLLGVPHYVMNFRAPFEEAVIKPWVDAYLHGETLNPCIACNRSVRFGTFLTKADELGAEYIATGHYARVDHRDGRFRLLRAIDAAKDQSYVLHVLGQHQLARTLFPLGTMVKPQVRQLATDIGLPVAQKPDSQELCFVPDNDYVGYVRRQASTGPGAIEDVGGARLGTHAGLEAFTIGQRRGLGLGGGAARYVVALDATRNTVVVGGRADALASTVGVEDVHWIALDPPARPIRAQVKLRYRMPPSPATVHLQPGRRASVVCDAPAWAPAPGQSAVFYAGDEVLGGGVIVKDEAA
ncbi:MAG: tRNA 2-thiouridine(34) synthase MnmA [Actinobacteria bacterium]|nr:tRNA 2-thiouridine(34) synthase MnmA [Actinomycetota bacterium]